MFGFFKRREQLTTNIGEEAVVFTLHRKANARRISLHIDKDGLRVTAPRFASAKKVTCIVKEKKNWVEKWMHFYAAAPKPPVLQAGSVITYLGEQCFVAYARAKREKVELNNGVLTLFLKSEANAERVLQKWFAGQAGELAGQRVSLLSDIVGVEVNRIRIKNHRRRWASCSSGKNLNFNWRMAMAPLDVVDYLVIHELVHLKHFNHDTGFWEEVQRFCPGYAKHEEWLKKNGSALGF